MWEEVSTIPENVGFSRRTLLHGIRSGEFGCFLCCLYIAKEKVSLRFNFLFLWFTEHPVIMCDSI